MTNDSGARREITGFGRWMALIAALLGWMFDGAEMGVFSLVGRDAMRNLLQTGTEKPSEDAVGFYFGVVVAVFLVGAATGGVLFGWLGDRIGRVRAMSLSVLAYALFTGACGFARTPFELGLLRFIAALGMGGEWSLGVALVMEVWPNRSRALMAGLIGAAANCGYFLVGIIGIGLNATLKTLEGGLLSLSLPSATVEMLVAYKGWRIMMMLGTLPAVLTFFFRLFVPESAKWEEEQQRGGTSNWMSHDLAGVLVGALGPALIIWIWSDPTTSWPIRAAGTLFGLVLATAGYLYPVLRFLQRTYAQSAQPTAATGANASLPTRMPMSVVIRRMLLAACLSGVALLGTWSSIQWASAWAGNLTETAQKQATEKGEPLELTALTKNPREYTQIATSLGAVVGTILAALAGDWFGRRVTYCGMCVLSLCSMYWFYQFHATFGPQFLFAAFLGGATTASFYGWLPLYLPELFPTNVRATGQGFGFNFGRILAAIGTLQMSALLPMFKTQKTFAGIEGGYPVMCSTICLVYLVGLAIFWFAPETKGQPLPD